MDVSQETSVALPLDPTSETIDLRRKGLSTLPLELQKCERVKSLIADENHLSSIPDWLFKLSKLKVISLRQQDVKRNPNYSIPDASEGGLKDLPEAIGECKSLQELYLTENKLATLPPTMKKLTSLTMIDLMGNSFKEIPKVIFLLTNLRYLGISGNYIEEIPKEIRELKKLKILRLSNNQLTSLPAELFTLTNLISLSLRHNKIKTLSKEILNLTNLVPENNIHSSFNLGTRNTKFNLKWENGLQMEGNLLQQPPQETCDRGIKEIVKFFKEEEAEEKERLERNRPDEFYVDLIQDLSDQIGHDFLFLAQQLGFTHFQVEQFQIDNPHSAKNRNCHMLQKWISKMQNERIQKKDIAKLLMEALRKVKRVDLAENVEEVVGELS